MLLNELFTPTEPAKKPKGFLKKGSWKFSSTGGNKSGWKEVKTKVGEVEPVQHVKTVKVNKVKKPAYNKETAPTGKINQYKELMSGDK